MQEKIIVVEPATEVVYVPAYSPTVVYGSVWAPATYYYPWYSYPSSYWYPPGYVASNIISFGVGMAVGAAIWGNWNWGHCNWRGRGVTINNNFNFSRNINTRNFKVNKGGGRYSNWQHNVNHRGGVRYRDSSSQAAVRQGRGRPRELASTGTVPADSTAPVGARPGACRQPGPEARHSRQATSGESRREGTPVRSAGRVKAAA